MITSSTTRDQPEDLKSRPSAAGAGPLPTAVRQVTVLKHPMAQHALTTLRHKHTPSHHFRRSSNQLLLLLVTEATRSLQTRAESVPTATETVVGQVVAKPIVFLAIARHGLGLAHRMVESFPDLLVGTVGHDVSPNGLQGEARLHLPNAPALGDARVIVFDPVVATGATASRAISLVQRSGGTDICLVSFLASAAGLDTIQARAPSVEIWTAAIETRMDRHGPRPGLGDFAARLFG